MTEWRRVTLADVSERVDYGFTASARDNDSLARYLRVTDIAKPHLDWEQVPGCEIEPAKFERYALRSGDLVIARSGSVGYSKRIKKGHPVAIFASYLVRFRPDRGVVNSSFLAAVVESTAYRQYVVRNAGGAAQPNANARVLGSFPFALPDLLTQRRVGDLADTLDDLLENNRRRIQLLEQMVRAIYREWLVDFRYPGHDNVSLVGSPIGPTPEGWELTTVADALTALGGGTPSKSQSDYWRDGTIPWFTPSDLTRTRRRYSPEPERRITDAGLAKSSAQLFPPGSVLMTSRATLGVLTIARTSATTNQGFIVIPPDDRWSPSFIREWLAHKAEDLAAVATGATFKEITKGAFRRLPFLIPGQTVLVPRVGSIFTVGGSSE